MNAAHAPAMNRKTSPKTTPIMSAAQRKAYDKLTPGRRKQMREAFSHLKRLKVSTTVEIHKARGGTYGNVLTTMAVLLDLEKVGKVRGMGDTWNPEKGAEHLRGESYTRIWAAV